tara:strand:- start:186 stop:557 length:372 start_codon:yes stop_codon:yes gene_type:complete
MEYGPAKRLVAIVLSLPLLAGCVTASVTSLMDRSAYPVPELDVRIFLPEDDVLETCERVALIEAKGGLMSNEGKVYKKFRQEAGKRGANAVVIQAVEDSGVVTQIFLGTEHEGNAIAVWCPDL